MSRNNRRKFLGAVAGAAGLAASGLPAKATPSAPLSDAEKRRQAALQMRQEAATFASRQPLPEAVSNGDETKIPRYAACFSKGLPHAQTGEVDPAAYRTLLKALSTGKHADFENISRGSGMKLVDPQSAFAYQLEGSDSHALSIAPPPAFSSAESASEMVELYWQARARDVAFADYSTSPVIRAAAEELNQLKRPTLPITPATIFRGTASGCLDGPYVSQFLVKPFPLGSTWIEQRYRVPAQGIDFLTAYPEWYVIQTGVPPYRELAFDPKPRYLRGGRDLAEWVHYDFLYQAFHNAALILLNLVPETILNNNAYWSRTNPYKYSKVQTGFATFGGPHVCDWLGRVTTAALKAAWYQKWAIHRRLRPEAFGGRVHQRLTGAPKYAISAELLESEAVRSTYQANKTYLLPQAFPEGSPLHPAYPAGHATVAGACSALLKAFFDETGLVTDTFEATPDGLSLMHCKGVALTVGGEVNKLAFNVAVGREFAGIHYRSDGTAGFRLGEDVAIAMMQDLVNTLTEDFAGFRFTRIDGSPVVISKRTS